MDVALFKWSDKNHTSGTGIPHRRELPFHTEKGGARMTMHATDRQIIERLLIPALMQVVIISMRRSLGDDAGVLDPISDLLGEALREPVEGLPPERVGKLVRRSKRATERYASGEGRLPQRF
jgi:hypothetical protein